MNLMWYNEHRKLRLCRSLTFGLADVPSACVLCQSRKNALASKHFLLHCKFLIPAHDFEE